MKRVHLITLVSTFSLLSFLHAENLYVLSWKPFPDIKSGTVGVYDSDTGAAINQSLISITNYYSYGIAVAGTNLYISTWDGVSKGQEIAKYNSINGDLIWKTFLENKLPAPNNIAAQGDTVYVLNDGVMSTYNASNGSIKNQQFITGVQGAMAISGNIIYVGTSFDTSYSTIGKYNATTGLGIDYFITGVYPYGICVNNNILYTFSSAGVGKYNADTGVRINKSFITPSSFETFGNGIIAVGTNVYIPVYQSTADGENSTISKYNAQSGSTINSTFIPLGSSPSVYLAANVSTSSDSSDVTSVQFTNSFSFSAIARIQNTQLPAVRGIATTSSPRRWTLNTANLLQFLAIDKYALGQYPATSFPVGSKIVCISTYYPSQINPTNIDLSYKVLSKSNTLIADVSDIISLSIDGKYRTYLESGKVNTISGLYAPAGTNDFISTITFDDTWISGGANIKCYLSGVTKNFIINTAPINGAYKETQITTQAGAFGEGYFSGSEMIITGGFTQSSTNTLKLP
jgi:hypothetical protein